MIAVRRGLAVLIAVATLGLPRVASAELWSLAYPPLAAGSTTPNLTAPLLDWTLWIAFNSQSACEGHRALWQMVVKAEDDESVRVAGRRAVFAQGIPPPNADMDALEGAAQRWVRDTGTKLRRDKGAASQVLVAQCISATDPRLEPKPAR